VVGCLALAAIVFTPSVARAWLFEEHANIGRLALDALPADAAATFARLWSASRRGDAAAEALCPQGAADPTHDRTWTCVDFGALPAVAGDHSCSPSDLWKTVTRAKWFGDVYANVAETERLLHARGATTRTKLDAWHQGNLNLQQVDPDYLTRAKGNNAHFVLARDREDDLSVFFARVASPGAPRNATEAYAAYHLAALAAAAELAATGEAAADYPTRAVRVLSTEAFALHFLEDSFSAGHFVGMSARPLTDESLPERAGTHDYYCERGLDARTWDRTTSYAAHGDAFQTDLCLESSVPPAADQLVEVCGAHRQTAVGRAASDLAVAAAAVAASLQQVLEVAAGRVALDPSVGTGAGALDSVDVCSEPSVGLAEGVAVQRAVRVLCPVLARTPEPYRVDPALPQ
jgi:hypothetical protein